MELVIEMLQVLKRCAALESGLRQPGGPHVTEEQEMTLLRARLLQHPNAVAAILQAAQALRRPVDTLEFHDVRRLL